MVTKDELFKRLENGIKEAMDSEKFREYLRVQAHFHNYSFNNTMLIYLQRPDATQVAGYKTWQKLGRQVMKGEKGISILAPCPYKYEMLMDKIDPKTQEPVRDPETGEIIKEKVEVQGLRFKKVTVFDISQTTGKELPSICNELQGNSVSAEKIIKAIKQISNVPIIDDDITTGAKGYYSRDDNIIVLKKGMSLDQTAKTLVHEYAHSQLHNDEAAYILDRATKEVQAESVAFVVSEYFGLDTSNYSFEYLASWSSGKELSELKKSLDIIQKTANKIIEDMEKVIVKDLELQRDSGQAEKQIQEDSKNIKDRIVEIYSKEFSAIKYISDSTAEFLNHINKTQGRIMSIEKLKQAYEQAGKRLEHSNSVVHKNEFNALHEVINDLKQAQLKDMQARAYDKVILSSSKAIELVQ